MHQCNPSDMQGCNSYCDGPLHVDLAYSTPEMAQASLDAVQAMFERVHRWRHKYEWHTPPCVIVGLRRIAEAPDVDTRYPIRFTPHITASTAIAWQVVYRPQDINTQEMQEE